MGHGLLTGLVAVAPGTGCSPQAQGSMRVMMPTASCFRLRLPLSASEIRISRMMPRPSSAASSVPQRQAAATALADPGL